MSESDSSSCDDDIVKKRDYVLKVLDGLRNGQRFRVNFQLKALRSNSKELYKLDIVRL